MEVTFKIDCANLFELRCHLEHCDSSFIPTLSSRLDIGVYAEKLKIHARRFEAWNANMLVGLVAIYLNRKDHAFITNVSVLPAFWGRNIANTLLKNCIDFAKRAGFKKIDLEVSGENEIAIQLYRKVGFVEGMHSNDVVTFSLDLFGE